MHRIVAVPAGAAHAQGQGPPCRLTRAGEEELVSAGWAVVRVHVVRRVKRVKMVGVCIFSKPVCVTGLGIDLILFIKLRGFQEGTDWEISQGRE